MFRLVLCLFVVISLAWGQNLPALKWVQELNNSGTESMAAGLGLDAQGNIYVAGSTTSATFPVKAAAQTNLGSAGVFKIDGTAYVRLGPNWVVSALASDPANPNVFYAVSSGSAVKSVDGGNTWSTLALPSKLVQRFAVDPNNSQNVYAAATDLGVLKSSNGGATWTAANNGLSSCANCGFPAGSFVAWNLWIDPNTSALFVYYQSSLARSADGAASWQTIGPVSNGFSVYFETPKPGVVYLFPSSYGPLKSTDDGLTFQGALIPVNSVFSDPSQPGRLLGNGSAGVFESDDDGATWALQLKISGGVVAADWANRVLYASGNPSGIVQISADLKTVTPVGPTTVTAQSLVLASGHVYVPNTGGHNAFVTKLDASGNVIYSTYYGGSGDDPAVAMAVDAAGNVYVTGNTSGDFPTSEGAYSSAAGGIFLFKLNPDGSLAYSTNFATTSSTAGAIAIDSTGAAYLTGSTNGSLPVTPGAYQGVCGCAVLSTGFFSVVELDAFVAKFDATGSKLTYSTYLGVANAAGKAIALASDGSVYVASGPLLTESVFHLNATGSSLLGNGGAGISVGALAVGPDGSVFMDGLVTSQFQPTAGAFETKPLPTPLPYQGSNNLALVKMDGQLQHVLAATYLGNYGGPYGPVSGTLTVDAAGNVYVAGGSTPQGLPTRTVLFGGFGPSYTTGYLSVLSGDLSTLLFSTYLGDNEAFSVKGVAVGSGGNVVIGGATTLNHQSGFASGNVYVNRLMVAAPPALRIDSIENAASMLDGAVSPGETIIVSGAGFDSGAQLLMGGLTASTISISPAQIVAMVPASLPIAPAVVQVQMSGASTNSVLIPVAATSPGLFSSNGTGTGSGYIVNQDGTLNSPANPALLGANVTIFATGVGAVSFTGGYAVTAASPSVFMEGFYCNGVAAMMGTVAGFPGSVYQLTVTLPTIAGLTASNPDLASFVFPPLVGITLQIAGESSQNALAISIQQ